MFRTAVSVAGAIAIAVSAFAAPSSSSAQAVMHGQKAAMDALNAPKLALKGKFALAYDDDSVIEVVRYPVERQGDQMLLYTVQFLAEDLELEGKTISTMLDVLVVDCKTKAFRSLGAAGYDADRNRVAYIRGTDAVSTSTQDVALALAMAAGCLNRFEEDEIAADLDEAEELAAYAFLSAAIEDLEDALADD